MGWGAGTAARVVVVVGGRRVLATREACACFLRRLLMREMGGGVASEAMWALTQEEVHVRAVGVEDGGKGCALRLGLQARGVKVHRVAQ